MQTSKEKSLTRTASIRQMEQIVCGLFSAAKGQGGGLSQKMRQSLHAKCLQCAVVVTGAELYLLAAAPAVEQANTVRRLRLHRCAREGCEFNLYQITFEARDDFDWEKFFWEVKLEETTSPEVAQEEEVAETRTAELLGPKVVNDTMARMSALAAMILLLLLCHRLYSGGRIPFLREPEKFKVDISAASESPEYVETE